MHHHSRQKNGVQKEGFLEDVDSVYSFYSCPYGFVNMKEMAPVSCVINELIGTLYRYNFFNLENYFKLR